MTKCYAFLLMAGSLMAQETPPVVPNGHFSASDSRGQLLGWDLPQEGGWRWVDDDGFNDHTSLTWSAKAEQPGGLTHFTSPPLELPAGPGVIRVALKPDEALTPRIILRSEAGERHELTRIEATGAAGIWQVQERSYHSEEGGYALVEVQVVRKGGEGELEALLPAGKVSIDALEIIPKGEAAPIPPALKRPPNLAAGRPYSYHPIPNYPHTASPENAVQLTDGAWTKGYFWTQKTTVGWVRTREIEVTLDLGEHQPIAGVMVHSAAGAGGVNWPESIEMLVSIDGRRFHSVADLVELSARHAAPPVHYATHRFEALDLHTHGRYLKLIIKPNGTTFFSDEIEVYRGEEGWKTRPLPGPAREFGSAFFGDPFNNAIKHRLALELEIAQKEIATLSDGKLETEAQRLVKALEEMPPLEPEGFYGVYPFCPLQREIYALLGAARAQQQLPALQLWSTHRWNPLQPTDRPPTTAPVGEPLRIAAMKGESRAGVFNLTNNTDREQEVELFHEGLPQEGSFLEFHEVLWLDSAERETIGSALPLLERGSDGRYRLRLPAGMTRQIWVRATVPPSLGAGSHRGKLRVEREGQTLATLPVELKVFEVAFPQRPRLHLSGWEYSDTFLYGLTKENRAPLIEHLRERGVDSPWATTYSFGFGEFDREGRMITAPSTEAFDGWVERWPDARHFHVFSIAKEELDGSPLDSDLFQRKVAAWIDFWVEHAKGQGVEPGKLSLLLVDESRNSKEDEIFLHWARAIKAAQPEIQLFDTGTRAPERNTPELIAQIDLFCPHRPTLFRGGEISADFYRELTAKGKKLYLYSCDGVARVSDPYSYYLLQAWDVFALGGQGSFFWSFTGTGGSDPWNPYLAKDTIWTPGFLGPDSITTSKQMEAITESANDFEYLSLLRERIATLEAAGGHPLLKQARALLAAAPSRVLDAPGARAPRWSAEKDRAIADEVRIEIATLLEKL